MRLIQIPFSHNCVKVRRALDLKGLEYETTDIRPMDRTPVTAASGQGLVPALVDGDRSIADSTEILRHLEREYPDRPLLPEDPTQQAECWVLEDWADAVLMALTRRLAYHAILNTPGAIERLFFPRVRGLRRKIMARVARRAVSRRFGLSDKRNRRDEREARRLAALAVTRIGGRPYLVGDACSVADIGLASMAAPLWATAPAVLDDPDVVALLAWCETVLGPELVALYRPGTQAVTAV